MKIVLVTPWVPHPFGQTVARWYYVLASTLAKKGHQIECLTCSGESQRLVNESKDLMKSHGVQFSFFPQTIEKNFLRRKFRSLIRPYSELAEQKELRQALKKSLRGADLLHLEGLVSGWLSEDSIKTLIDIEYLATLDWETRRNLTLREKKSLWQMRRVAKKILGKAQHICSLTERLRQAILLINPKAKTWVTPLGLDLSLYPLLPPAQEPIIGVLGSMHWYPSRSAAIRLITKIWPLIQSKVPHCKLFIAGWDAKKYLSQYLPRPGVSLEENLKHPEDFFSRVSVMVYAPERGSGMKVKVLESMAYGVPVVTTWEGAEGIEYQRGRELMVEETNEGIADATVRLLQNPEDSLALRHQARKLVEEKYSAEPTVNIMENVYQQILAPSPPPSMGGGWGEGGGSI